ncbi:16S rRNA (cytidine(1402)-2'-O)-methyltransferase [bacterium]|nr:16S rRNA (cytidine(1402)-2'-O)-methyltransferase [bacterium]
MLYIVSTPIGNLNDISQRAIKVLKEVDLILCEDTRRTKKLLNFYKIKTPTLSYHQHSKLKKIKKIFDLLKQGKNLALVSDAGTPGISDPGNELIAQLLEKNKKIKISPIPGPSAIITALSVSGFETNKFLFLGFLPKKKKRKKIISEIINSPYPVVFYESPYRLLKTLNELKSAGIGESQKLVVCRELTKKFETIYRGRISEVIELLKNNKDNLKGEFTIVIDKK